MCFLKLKKSEHFLIYMVPVIPFLFRKGNAFLFRNDRNEPISCRGLLSCKRRYAMDDALSLGAAAGAGGKRRLAE